jgi:AmmeMemoRadiSam system protein B
VIDSETAKKLTVSNICTADTVAHEREHSLEVIVPILKYLNPDVKITPITVMRLSAENSSELGQLLFDVADEDTMVILSSDMNHFENVQITETKDRMALDCVLSLDEEALAYRTTMMKISMCGSIPAGAVINYCKKKKCPKVELLEHTHSGMVNGNNQNVVGYAGVIFHKYNKEV